MKHMDLEKALKEINAAVVDYIEEKIDEKELVNRLLPYNNPKFEEECVRNGLFIIPSLLHNICDRLSTNYENEEKTIKVFEEVKNFLKEYYDEMQTGVDPRYTKIQFSQSWFFPEFIVEVKNGKQEPSINQSDITNFINKN